METKRELSRRHFLGFGAATAAGTLLSACAPAATSEVVKETVVVEKEVEKVVTATPAPVTPVKLSIMESCWGGAGVKVSTGQRLWAEFDANHPEFELDVLFTPERWMDKLTARVAGGDIPDVVAGWCGDHYQFLDAGMLLQLDPLIETDPSFRLEDYYPRLVEHYQNDEGNQIAIPWNYATEMFYYNKRLFDAAGLSYPDSTWTWDDVLEAAQALTKDTNGDGVPDVWGFSFRQRRIDAYVFAWGSDYMDEKAGKCLMDTPESITAHQFLADCLYKHQVSPTVTDMAGLAKGHRTLFISNKCAMLTDAEHGVFDFNPAMEAGEIEYDVTIIPEGPVERATQYYPGGASIFTNAANRGVEKEAWECVKFSCGDLYAREMTTFLRDSPPALIRANEFKWLEYEQMPENRQAFVENPDYGRVPFFLRRYGNHIKDIVWPGLDPMWLGKASAAEVAAEICPQVNEKLQELMAS